MRIGYVAHHEHVLLPVDGDQYNPLVESHDRLELELHRPVRVDDPLDIEESGIGVLDLSGNHYI